MRICAYSRISPLVKGEDMALVVLEFENGVTGIIDISRGSRAPAERALPRGHLDSLLVEGSAGAIELDPYQDDAFVITTAAGTHSSSCVWQYHAYRSVSGELFQHAQPFYRMPALGDTCRE